MASAWIEYWNYIERYIAIEILTLSQLIALVVDTCSF